MWAYGVNRTLEKGFPPDHHLEVINSILGFVFEGITGTVSLDNVGDRMNDFDVTMTQNGQVSWYTCTQTLQGLMQFTYTVVGEYHLATKSLLNETVDFCALHC